MVFLSLLLFDVLIIFFERDRAPGLVTWVRLRLLLVWDEKNFFMGVLLSGEVLSLYFNVSYDF
jgi:hypothetical protein